MADASRAPSLPMNATEAWAIGLSSTVTDPSIGTVPASAPPPQPTSDTAPTHPTSTAPSAAVERTITSMKPPVKVRAR